MSQKSRVQTSKNKDQISAILLAAGRSERMGAFKPLLPFGHSTVIESCLDYLRAGGVRNVVVVVGHRSDDIRKRLKRFEVSYAVNRDSTSEMAASIALGIEQLPASTRATLIALTDQPAISASVVRALTAHWEKGSKIVKPQFAGRGGHPVLIDLNFRAELSRLNQEGGLKAFFAAHREEVCRVAVESPFVVRDMDTWDDYLALHQEIFGFAPESGG